MYAPATLRSRSWRILASTAWPPIRAAATLPIPSITIPALAPADAESLLQGQVRFYDPTSQFNINTDEFWDGDQTYASPNHPAVGDFTGSYGGFIDAFYNAQSQMSGELHETAANIRKMATVYKATEDVNERDVFGVSLPAPYNPPGQ